MPATHVGDCATMAFHHRPGKAPLACQPWERFAVVEQELLDQANQWIQYISTDGQGWLFITTGNGHALYREVGSDPDRRRVIFELVEGLFKPEQLDEI